MTKEEEGARILMEVLPLIQRKLMHFTGDAGGTTVTVELRILMLLEKQGTMMLSAVGRALAVAKPNLVRPVQMLEEWGLIKRDTDRRDHRVSWVTLTDQGKQHLRTHGEKVSAYLSQLEAQLTLSEQAKFYKALKSLHCVLGSLE